MTLRKWVLAVALAASFTAGAAGTTVPVVGPVAAQAQDSLDALARPALDAWLEAVFKRDQALLDAVLAPEFQILRADGTAHDKAGYMASSLPVIEAMPEVEDLVVTGTPELLVARYLLVAKQTRDGVAVEITAPRLSVFRKDGDRYRILAHANFAALER
jgi:ketosteroid isomerase-like protein